MPDSQIATQLALLKDLESSVRAHAARALGRIGDISTVPALTEALKDRNVQVRESAAEALGNIGDLSAVGALVHAADDQHGNVRVWIYRALGAMGNSHTMPRKILASPHFSTQTKVDILDRLRRLHYTNGSYTVPYSFHQTRSLCRKVLEESDDDVKAGARAVMNWLDQGQMLVRGSQHDPATESQQLLRASRGTSQAKSDELLRGTEEPEQHGTVE